MIINCKQCQKEIKTIAARKKFCNNKCCKQHWRDTNEKTSEKRAEFAFLARERRRLNPEYFKNINRKCRLKREYGINEDIYNKLFNFQSGACYICKQIPEEILHIDHCHTSGEVRGLLCRKCNSGLGYFEDNIERLEMAKGYLKSYPTTFYEKTNEELYIEKFGL